MQHSFALYSCTAIVSTITRIEVCLAVIFVKLIENINENIVNKQHPIST